VFILCCNAFLLIGECLFFVVLGLVFSIPSQEIGSGKCLRNDLFCVAWDIKPTQLINQCMNFNMFQAMSKQH